MTEAGAGSVVAVFGASTSAPGSDEYRQGEECGRLLGTAGYRVATGGYGGTMEAVSRGANSAGAHVIGITAPTVFPHRSGPNAYVSEERPAASLIERIGLLISAADAVIALPGSLGTATELLVAWNHAYVADDEATRPVVAVGGGWASLVSFLERELAIPDGLVEVVTDVEEAVGLVSARIG